MAWHIAMEIRVLQAVLHEVMMISWALIIIYMYTKLRISAHVLVIVLDWLASIHISVLLRFCVSYLATLEAIAQAERVAESVAEKMYRRILEY